ncbi:MAG: NADH-quinone oxidoreductase subunit L [bacterium]
MNFFVENAWIIPALPLWVFLIILFGQNLAVYEDKKISMYLTVGATALGLIFSCFILGWSISHPGAVYEQNITWLQAGSLKFSMGWLVDNLSAMMLMVVTTVSIMIQIYSHEYMNKDEGYNRFFAYLALFNFSMLGLVLSTNLFQMYIFWELVGLSSYLLIGFWFTRPSAASAAKKAFIMNRIGDFGLLVGIIAFLFFAINSSNGIAGLNFTLLDSSVTYVMYKAGPVIFSLIALVMFLGPIAKSAQFPLYTWLPDAMEGPTPISALIHAATMVAAGVYLIARAYPIFDFAPLVMLLMAWIGAITALLTAIIALTQYDIKKTLAYSTCSQLGYMVMAMGVGAYSAGLFHLMTHAYFKAMLFLCAGAVIHGLADQQDMRYMGGLRKRMPVVAYTYLIGTLAISGIFLSGFWSKEEIFSGIAEQNYWVLLGLGLLIAVMTAFYMFRTYFLTFEGEYKGHAHPHNPSKIMTIPLIILAIPSAILGFVLISSFDNFINPFYNFGHHPENLLIPAMSLLASFLGLFIAAAMYWDKFKKNIFSINPDKVREIFPTYYKISFNRLYLDELYYGFINIIFLPVAALLSWFDKNIIDGIVNFIAFITKLLGSLLRLLQNGNVQTYVTILFGGFVIITMSILIYWVF